MKFEICVDPYNETNLPTRGWPKLTSPILVQDLTAQEPEAPLIEPSENLSHSVPNYIWTICFWVVVYFRNTP